MSESRSRFCSTRSSRRSGVDLLGLELADAGRFFEDQPAVARRRLQQRIDLALLDDAVGLGRDAGAGQQVADVAQPAGLAVDQIFAFAAAIDAAGDVHFAGVDRPAGASALSNVSVTSAVPSGPRVAQPLKMTSVISLPRSALGALRAEHPLDGVDDVRFARAVGPDDDADAARETRTACDRQSS